jgi:hypothetical protein
MNRSNCVFLAHKHPRSLGVMPAVHSLMNAGARKAKRGGKPGALRPNQTTAAIERNSPMVIKAVTMCLNENIGARRVLKKCNVTVFCTPLCACHAPSRPIPTCVQHPPCVVVCRLHWSWFGQFFCCPLSTLVPLWLGTAPQRLLPRVLLPR